MGLTYTIKEEKEKYIAITGYDGAVEHLQIPDSLTITDGEGTQSTLPVREIASHAFSHRETLREVVIPVGCRRIGSFAFYHCPQLQRICLTDSVTDYHDGVIKLCTALREVQIRFSKAGNFRLLKEMLGDNDGSISYHLQMPEGEAVLWFPDFSDDFHEDTYARVLHEKIEGSGYEYRQVVSRGEIDFRQYDRLFSRGQHENISVAAGIALGRLAAPYMLREEARLGYEDFLRSHSGSIATALLTEEREAEFTRMMTLRLLTEEGVTAALPLLSEKRKTALSALLMDYHHRNFGGKQKAESFSF